MSALPQFFTKSKIFQASTYSSLRSRLFSGLIATTTSGEAHSKVAKSSTYLPRVHNDVGDQGYLELQEIPKTQTLAEPTFYFGADNESSKGILKTTKYDVTSGPSSEL